LSNHQKLKRTTLKNGKYESKQYRPSKNNKKGGNISKELSEVLDPLKIVDKVYFKNLLVRLKIA
jgi:hypothetical protein